MKNLTPTPHNNAKLGEIAKTILLPGDALRAKMIVEKFLTDVKCVNEVRNNYCYTGKYKGKTISIMSTGMGCPSMGIYSYELFNFYGVENAIRIGSIGSLSLECKLNDIIVANETLTNTNYLNFYKNNGETTIQCSEYLLARLKQKATQQDRQLKIAKIYTSDTFYNTDEENNRQKMLGVAGVEMECAALYLNAKNALKNALCICTVSDEILSDKHLTSEERQNSFLDMVTLALDFAIEL